MRLCREDFETILDITKCKTKDGWGADPMQGVETKVKSAFTRSFNKAGLPVRCTIMVEDAKKSRGKKAAPPPVNVDDDEIGGEIAEVRFLTGEVFVNFCFNSGEGVCADWCTICWRQ
jgi:hypothetical protein